MWESLDNQTKKKYVDSFKKLSLLVFFYRNNKIQNDKLSMIYVPRVNVSGKIYYNCSLAEVFRGLRALESYFLTVTTRIY